MLENGTLVFVAGVIVPPSRETSTAADPDQALTGPAAPPARKKR